MSQSEKSSQFEKKQPDNPLLAEGELPAFDRIQPEHVVPAMRERLSALEAEVAHLERDAEPTWTGLVEPLERLGDRLEAPWSVVGHLMGVRNSDALREAHSQVQAQVIAFGLRVGQSPAIFRALRVLHEGSEWDELDTGQRRIVESLLREARHAGVGLAGEARQRFNEIEAELGKLATEFSNHVLDATKAFSLTLRQQHEVEGLPVGLLELAAQSAREAGEESASPEAGPWRITLDLPSLRPFLEHSRRRELREELYRAYIGRAAGGIARAAGGIAGAAGGELDNAPLIAQVLRLRVEKARLLGFASYAELSLDSKMAPDVETVRRLLERLRVSSYAAAEADLAELSEFARTHAHFPQREAIAHWDVAFWSERLREERFDYSDESLRPWFPLPVVLEGLFDLARRLFGIVVLPADSKVPVWHDDVRFFVVNDDAGSRIASFYLDPYSRPKEKNGGAWMDECRTRSRLLARPGEGCRLPVAYVVCNLAPPVAGKPSRMSFVELRTLFHEFGHALQHMLTRVDYGMASGIRNVEWDAVELASQFMENWCYDRDTLRTMSAHVETGEPLPEELFQKLLGARSYRSGSDMLRQLYFALTDLALHAEFDPTGSETAFDLQREIAERATVMAPLPEDRSLCSFSHIFAGGYAAGYYSYKWAEVLAADAFGAFEEAGLDNAAAIAAVGRRYRETILALGGSRAPMDVFKSFRGREPSPEALLRHAGLEAT